MCTYWLMSEEKRAPPDGRSLVPLLAKHKRVLVLSAGRGVGWSHMMQLVDTEFAERGGSVLQSTMTRYNESVVNYAAEHYHKVNESYKNVVDHCNWCSGAWVCHGCLRKFKNSA